MNNTLSNQSVIPLVKEDFQISDPKGLPQDEIDACVNFLQSYFDRKSDTFAGYQVNLNIDYTGLAPFLNFNINNVGDPFVESNYSINSRTMEQAVLSFFAELFHADDKDYWGYIASGGTEANMYGAFLGREALQTNNRRPIAYYSEDTHYSVQKSLHLLNIEQSEIKSNELGQIQVDELIATIKRNDPEKHPPLLVINMGTTFKGAYDDLDQILSALDDEGIKERYIHIDAALGGLFLPFVEELDASSPVPIFDFRKEIDSIGVSGHKVIGTPFPCAVFMTLKDRVANQVKHIDYIETLDSTLAGSRNGMAPILLWYNIAVNGREGFSKMAKKMLDMSEFARKAISNIGYNAWKNDLGLSVIFDRPAKWIIRKWSLSTQGEYAHLFTMAHMDKAKIEKLCYDLNRAGRSAARCDEKV